MNFFEHQEAARRRTSLLVGYYALAVLAIIVALYIVSAFVFGQVPGKRDPEAPALMWDPELFLAVAAGAGGLILIGTFYKIASLRGGGASVATMLGGRRVPPNTTDPRERRLLNVVEEMAVASGTPIPPVYVLDDEPAINAFAAGFTPADAVVAVTRGTLEKLTRDELQGVIAHEFSHIFNGDMRLNLRLMGVLNGILVLSLVGYWMFRITARSSGGGSSRKGKGNPLAAVVILGLAMWIIGYIGVVFARLIKSAVSRQREYLADASAVQFTRNPLGIGGALKKIGAYSAGSRLDSPRAEEASHLFFANGIRQSFLGLMATHPPLKERIRRIDPQFDGDFADAVRGSARDDATSAAFAAEAPPPAPPSRATPPPPPLPQTQRVPARPEAVVARVGTLQPEHLAFASQLLASVPATLREACRDVEQAQAVVFALLLSPRPEIRTRQLAAVTGTGLAHTTVESLAQQAAGLGPQARLPLADLALTALSTLPPDRYPGFRKAVFALAAADDEVSLFEYALMRIMVRRLDPVFGQALRPVIRYTSLEPLTTECGLLLSALAWFGNDQPERAQQAFDHGASQLELGHPPALLPKARADLQALDSALDRLAETAPPLKQRLLAAAVACVGADGQVTVDESEAIRAVADSLGCPLPPMLAPAA